MITTLLAAGALTVAWVTADFPRPAWNFEVEKVGNYGKGTRLLVLHMQLKEARIDLAVATAVLKKDPTDTALATTVAEKEQRVFLIKQEISKLK